VDGHKEKKAMKFSILKKNPLIFFRIRLAIKNIFTPQMNNGYKKGHL